MAVVSGGSVVAVVDGVTGVEIAPDGRVVATAVVDLPVTAVVPALMFDDPHAPTNRAPTATIGIVGRFDVLMR